MAGWVPQDRGTPWSGLGYPQPGLGYPLARTGVPPGQDWGTPPHRTGYAAGGLPRAVGTGGLSCCQERLKVFS